MERVILHSDLNNFYAAVECLYNPSTRLYPVAVCGDPDARHGIVLAKNQLAKNHGIKTGEVIWQAKQKCPDLIVLKPDYPKYIKFSKLAKEIYAEYTDRIEAFGIDECWLDVSDSTSLFGDGEKIADVIRHRILFELGITVSVGVSYNKIFAKLGSDMKKPNATTVITKENYRDKVWPLPVSELLYVGRATSKKLFRLNVQTIGDLAQYDLKYLNASLGKWGIVLNHFAQGKDSSPVSQKDATAYIKSVGNSITAPRDMASHDDIGAVIHMLSDSVAARLRSHHLKCTGVQISVRDVLLHSCERQSKLLYPTFISSEIAEKSVELFLNKYEMKNSIRSIGVRGINLVSENDFLQLNFFADLKNRDKEESIAHTMDEIRNRFGYDSIKKGILMVDKELTGMNPKEEHTIHPVNFFEGAIL